MSQEVYCEDHPLTRMVCPRCIAAKGGKTTAKRHSHKELSGWGSMGGRPRKKARVKKSAKKKR